MKSSMLLNNRNKIFFRCSVLFFLCVFSYNLQAQELNISDTTVAISKKGVNAGAKKSIHEKQISGKIIDAATDQPVNGAEITVEGYASAFSKEDGTFSINVSYSTGVLIIKSSGYQIKEFPLKGQTSVTIKLNDDGAFSMYERSGNTFSDLSKLNFAFASSNTKNLFPVVETSLEEHLQSQFAEVRTVIRSGAPGIGGNMYIRGLNSMNGNSQPLIIVDGVPYENLTNRSSIVSGNFTDPLTSIDPQDIENITVLKDGFSIYGVKAANGAIIITTKRAKEAASKIVFSASWGQTMAPKSIPVLNDKEYRTFAMEQMNGAGYSELHISDQVYLNDDPRKSKYRDYHNNTNWQDEIFSNGTTQNYHINITGGDDIAKYGISLGYMDVQNPLKNTGLNRFNFRFNSDIDFTKNLFLALSISYSKTVKNIRDDGAIERSSPTYLALIKSPLVSPNELNPDGSRQKTLADQDFWNISNPISILEEGIGANTQHRLGLNGKLTYVANPFLTLSGTFGYNLDKLKESYFLPDKGVALALIERLQLYSRNVLKSNASHYIGLFGNFNVNYNKTFSFIHEFNANAGVRYQLNTYVSDGGMGHNSSNDSPQLSDNLINKYIFDESDEWKWASAYMDVNYALKNKYRLNLTLSGDGSSRAGANQQFGLLPSVGASWLASSEKFMSAAKALNILRFRASAGMVGSDDLGTTNPKGYFGAVPYMNMIGLNFQNLKNDDLKWESTTKTNLGLDLALFNERVSLSADVYYNKTADLITPQNVNRVSGSDFAYMNGGDLENKGLELSMDLRLVNTKNFKWSTKVTVAKYLNKLTSLPDQNKDILTSLENVGGATILSRVGKPIGLFYGYKSLGVFKTAQEASDANLYTYYENKVLVKYEAGDMRFEDKNNDHLIDKNDMQDIGNPNPDFYGSLAMRFSYKTIALDALFNGVYGNDVYNYLRSQTESMMSFNNQAASVLNRWKGEGQNTNMPKSSYMDPQGNSRFSDRWIEDGSFLRLKNLTLSWNIPQKVLFMNGFTIFATANNVFVLTKYLGADPEFSSSNQSLFQGIDAGYISQSRSYVVGFKLNL